MKKINNLVNSISILKKELINTKQVLSEKEEELKFICPHDKLDKTILRIKDLVFPEIGLPCPKGGSCIYYKCYICGIKIFRDEEDPEFEKRVKVYHDKNKSMIK